MDLSCVKKILDLYLNEHGLIYYDAELVKEFGFLILRVLVDKKGGIDIDTLAEVNEYLAERIEEYDQDMPEYMLEVSSPGAEKKLRNIEEMTESIGMYVHAEIEGMIYEGTLEEVNEDGVVIRYNAKGRFRKVSLKHQEIKNIRLAVKI